MKTTNTAAEKMIPVNADNTAWKFSPASVSLDGHTFPAMYSLAKTGDVYVYSFTRTASLLKYKIMSDCDLRIVAVNPGTGRHAGMAGSISVSYKGGVVRVSAGLTIAQRRAIWADPAAYIGRVATVQYFEETQNSSGQKSLRFPVFKELREAGKSVSYA